MFEVDYDPLIDAVENIIYNNNIAYYDNNNINIIGAAQYIEIYNINGQLINQQAINTSSIQVNLQEGIYIVKIYNDNLISTNKIIVK